MHRIRLRVPLQTHSQESSHPIRQAVIIGERPAPARPPLDPKTAPRQEIFIPGGPRGSAGAPSACGRRAGETLGSMFQAEYQNETVVTLLKFHTVLLDLVGRSL
jgi:hypothetical protein